MQIARSLEVFRQHSLVSQMRNIEMTFEKGSHVFLVQIAWKPLLDSFKGQLHLSWHIFIADFGVLCFTLTVPQCARGIYWFLILHSGDTARKTGQEFQPFPTVSRTKSVLALYII